MSEKSGSSWLKNMSARVEKVRAFRIYWGGEYVMSHKGCKVIGVGVVHLILYTLFLGNRILKTAEICGDLSIAL